MMTITYFEMVRQTKHCVGDGGGARGEKGEGGAITAK